MPNFFCLPGKAGGFPGLVNAVATVVAAKGWCKDGISQESLARLCNALVNAGSVLAIDLDGLTEERRPVFAGEMAILRTVFASLGIEHMQPSGEALREGLSYEMMGRIRHEVVRELTVASLSRRFGIDRLHADRVRATALLLYDQPVESWGLMSPDYPGILGWAARLHEVGLILAHSQYQKPGAYPRTSKDSPARSRPCLPPWSWAIGGSFRCRNSFYFVRLHVTILFLRFLSIPPILYEF